MSWPFPSAEWASAYRDAINASADYRSAAATWTHGAVALVVTPRAGGATQDPVGIWLDLERGQCRASALVSGSAAARAPFVFTTSYEHWKAVLRSELAPLAGVLQRKIAFQGSLGLIAQFATSAEELVKAAGRVPTRFLDE